MKQHQSRPEFILFNQLNGVQESLKCILENDGNVSESTITYLIKIKDYFKKCSTNEPLSILPEIKENSTPGDLLVLVSAMQYALQTLLTKEEKESIFELSAKWIGLASKAKDLVIN